MIQQKINDQYSLSFRNKLTFSIIAEKTTLLFIFLLYVKVILSKSRCHIIKLGYISHSLYQGQVDLINRFS